jgi:hypothetical protein
MRRSRAALITERYKQMALFMDVHNVEGGVSAADTAGAHQADLATQTPYGVNYLRYWVDEEAGKIFCLVDAPDAEAANTVHRQAHGLVADEIYPGACDHSETMSITIQLLAGLTPGTARGTARCLWPRSPGPGR